MWGDGSQYDSRHFSERGSKYIFQLDYVDDRHNVQILRQISEGTALYGCLRRLVRQLVTSHN